MLWGGSAEIQPGVVFVWIVAGTPLVVNAPAP
jgi:hypothetical protein